MMFLLKFIFSTEIKSAGYSLKGMMHMSHSSQIRMAGMDHTRINSIRYSLKINRSMLKIKTGEKNFLVHDRELPT